VISDLRALRRRAADYHWTPGTRVLMTLDCAAFVVGCVEVVVAISLWYTGAPVMQQPDTHLMQTADNCRSKCRQ